MYNIRRKRESNIQNKIYTSYNIILYSIKYIKTIFYTVYNAFKYIFKKGKIS